MKKLYISLFACAFTGLLFGQQSVPVYEQYFTSDEEYLINPSFAGSSDDLVIKSSHRRQWADLSEGPNTTAVSAHANIVDRLGLGMFFLADENGNTKTNTFNVAAAYHIPIGAGSTSNTNRFSFGTSLSFTGLRFGGQTELPNDPLYDGETNIFIPYINFGGSVNYKGILLAASVMDIALSYNSPIVNELEPSPVYFYGMLGYDFKASQNFYLEPSVMYRFNKDDRKQLDANLRAKFLSGNNSFWGGASYRYDMSGDEAESLYVSPSIGADIGSLNFALSYNIGLTDIASEGGDGFTIGLGYNFDNFTKSGELVEDATVE